MEENNDLNIEQIKAMYDNLKSKLDQQDIINDKLIRKAMKDRVNGIKRIFITDVICALFVIIASPAAFHINPLINASWVFVAATDIMMLFCIYKSWSYDKALFLTDAADCDLIAFKGKVSEIRAKHKKWLKYAFIMAGVWFVWLCLEIILHSSDKKLALLSTVSVGIGLLIGGTIGIFMEKKVIMNCDDIIEQIEN